MVLSVGLPQRSSERAFHLEQGVRVYRGLVGKADWNQSPISRMSETWTSIEIQSQSTRDR